MKKHLLLFKTLIIACFAMITGGGISVAQKAETLASFSGQIASNSDWTSSGEWSSSYYKIYQNHSIESPTINFSGYTNITVKVTMRTYGGSDATASVLHIKQNGIELTTLTATNKSLNDYSASINVSGSASLSFTCEAKSNSKCLGVSAITITGVLDLPSSNIFLTENTGTISLGETLDISKYVSTADGYTGTVSYSLKSGEGIASVSNDGVITGLAAGQAVITVTAPAVEGFFAKSEADFIVTVNDSRTETTTTFGENIDNKTKFVFVGQESSFVIPTATISHSEFSGSIVYTSDNTSAIDVNTSTGELTFNATGKATITASFAGNSTYRPSSASYVVYYINDNITFSDVNSSFSKLPTSTYSAKGNGEEEIMVMKDNNNIDHSFIGHYYYKNNSAIQLYKGSGYIISPTFNFDYGYKVIVTCVTNTINISIGDQTVNGSGSTIEISTTESNQSFKIFTGAAYAQVSKIEIIPYTTKQKAVTKVTFPAASYEVIEDEESDFTSPTATLTDAEGKEIDGASLVYSISDNPFATIDSETGVVSFIASPAVGTATVTATYAGNETYNGAEASYTINYIANPYTTYTSFNDIKANAANGEKVRITLNNAQVVYANDKNVFVRDASGAICFCDLEISELVKNAVLNGTIKGKFSVSYGMPQLIKDGTNTNADNLNITAGEAAQPKDLTYGSFADYTCDLVKVNKGIVDNNGTDVKLMNQDVEYAVFYDKFGIKYSNPFNSAEVDVTGIVIPYVAKGSTETIIEIAPTNKYDIVYRFSENDETTHVGAVTDAKVAIKRTLSSDYWNTLCLPFSLSAEQITATFGGGTITKFSNVNENAEGTVMTFVEDTSIEASKPYLFKPAKTVENPVFEGVTITSNPADIVTAPTNGNYAFVGTYSKKDMATDQSEVFITTSGKLSYPAANANTIKGMRAFIQLPKTVNAKAFNLNIGGEATSIDTIDGGLFNGNATIYNLNGQKMSSDINGLAKGLYIVNGKKMIVK